MPEVNKHGFAPRRVLAATTRAMSLVSWPAHLKPIFTRLSKDSKNSENKDQQEDQDDMRTKTAKEKFAAITLSLFSAFGLDGSNDAATAIAETATTSTQAAALTDQQSAAPAAQPSAQQPAAHALEQADLDAIAQMIADAVAPLATRVEQCEAAIKELMDGQDAAAESQTALSAGLKQLHDSLIQTNDVVLKMANYRDGGAALGAGQGDPVTPVTQTTRFGAKQPTAPVKAGPSIFADSPFGRGFEKGLKKGIFRRAK